MAPKPKPASPILAEVRKAVDAAGPVRQHLCDRARINPGVMSRFMAGAPLTLGNLEQLLPHLGLELVLRKTKKEIRRG